MDSLQDISLVAAIASLIISYDLKFNPNSSAICQQACLDNGSHRRLDIVPALMTSMGLLAFQMQTTVVLSHRTSRTLAHWSCWVSWYRVFMITTWGKSPVPPNSIRQLTKQNQLFHQVPAINSPSWVPSWAFCKQKLGHSNYDMVHGGWWNALNKSQSPLDFGTLVATRPLSLWQSG